MESNRRPRNILFRVFDLIAQKADVVVAPIVVGRDEHRPAQSGKELWRKCKGARRKIECAGGVEVRQPGKMIQPMVPITPNHRIFESRPIAVMLP